MGNARNGSRWLERVGWILGPGRVGGSYWRKGIEGVGRGERTRGGVLVG